MNNKQIEELLYQALETEMGGQQVYENAVKCAKNPELREEWKKYLEETKHHEEVVRGVFSAIGLDAEAETPGRSVVRQHADTLISMMQSTLKTKPDAAQIVAAECIVAAEMKDHQNWELLGRVGEALKDKKGQAIRDAVGEVEDQEDEHLYHTRGWARELWIESLGMPAVIPPPEEEKSVTTMIGAARAEQSREKML
jgi:ferritin-like metal-binding protein YciE